MAHQLVEADERVGYAVHGAALAEDVVVLVELAGRATEDRMGPEGQVGARGRWRAALAGKESSRRGALSQFRPGNLPPDERTR
jgi:hypothetical protein